jgi:hypothetical protein
MTPEQKLKYAILARVAEWEDKPVPEYPCKNIDELYDELVASDAHWDGKNEVRCSGIETELPCPYSRHYESYAVGMNMPDGSWVGWTYWYGGGKHGEPEAIDWMDEAYDIECQEEEKLVVVQTFKARQPK